MSLVQKVEALLREDLIIRRLASSLRDEASDKSHLVSTAQTAVASRPALDPELQKYCNTDVQGVCKEQAEAEVSKARGSGYFGKKQYHEAAKAYSLALQKTPMSVHREFASKVLSNRALCLLKSSVGEACSFAKSDKAMLCPESSLSSCRCIAFSLLKYDLITTHSLSFEP